MLTSYKREHHGSFVRHMGARRKGPAYRDPKGWIAGHVIIRKRISMLFDTKLTPR
jgi:hypothetical protein